MSDTPETDKALYTVQHQIHRYSFPEHARQMERERNAARKALAEAIQEIQRLTDRRNRDDARDSQTNRG